MARQAVNGTITNGSSTFTVPGGKVAVLKVAFLNGGSGGVAVGVNGATVTNASSSTVFGPLCMNAGDVLSCLTGGGQFGFSGFIYDA